VANTVRCVTIVQVPPVGRTAVQLLETTAVFAASSRLPVSVSTIVPLIRAGASAELVLVTTIVCGRLSTAQKLVSGPLDDPKLGAIERQIAAARALDATFPLQQATLEVELPADAAGIQSLGWQEMQQLAARLLTET
jgi:hypothetical protein